MSKSYKETLLIGKTDFEMRGNLPKKEPAMQQDWYENNLYEQILDQNKGNEKFILHDGPPYANGNIHIGHALNKILKDFVVRFNMIDGKYSPFIPGWDTHGLPIETALAKKKVDRKKMTVAEFRKKCAEFALKQVEGQKEQFKRLGILADWENPYITLTPDYEYWQIKVFGEMAKQGLIYKGVKPVYWSPSSETTLAEAEIEYHEKTSPSIYVGFPVVDGKDILENGTRLVIWTTTPWTMPGNLAIATGEDFNYVVVEAKNEKFVLAEELVESLAETFEWETYKVVKTIKGSKLEGVQYEHPLYGRIQPVVIGHHVTLESGTGLVHIAPGHGEDDYIIGKKYGLDVLCPVNGSGVLTEEAGEEFAGMFYEKANKAIGEKLESLGALLSLKFIKHSYPHDWRTRKPIIFRVTPQWFASIKGLKDQMMNEIKEVKWYPKWGETRLGNMVADREDWCISRQRAWGVPLPVFYNEDGSEILEQETIDHVANLFKEHGSDIWFEWDTKDLLPKGYTNPKSPNGNFTKEKDIMDVWFDSGTSHHSALKEQKRKHNVENLPADLYLEGSDQYRGWFNSSLSTGVAMTGKAPYKAVVTHGFALDGKGYKMSKSLGNTVDPLKVCNQYGADVLRLWVSSVDYQSDVRISDDLIKQVSDSYRKIRNTLRFMLSNLQDFDPKKHMVKCKNLSTVDHYMKIRLHELANEVLAAYNEYEFDKVYRLITNYISNELSSFYLDYIKDVIYIDNVNSKARRGIQSVMFHHVMQLAKLLTPIIPHTTEEVYKHIPNFDQKTSIMLEDMPKHKECCDTKNIVKPASEKVLEAREIALKVMEEARADKRIGKSLTADLTLYANKEAKQLLESIDNLHVILMVSGLTIKDYDNAPSTAHGNNNIKAEVKPFEGQTCERCWRMFNELTDEGICPNCSSVVNG